MALSCTDIESILTEIRPVVTGGWIQKIHQPQALGITLEIRSSGSSIVLYMCADPRWARFHLLSKKYSNPPAPPPFCQFLRSHLEGGRIQEITQLPGDRLVDLIVRKNDQLYRLVIALLGKRTNILLLNEKNSLLRSLKESRFQIGEQFVPPTSPFSFRATNHPPWNNQRSQRSSKNDSTHSSAHPLSTAIEAYYDQKEQQDNEQRQREQQLTHARKLSKKAKEKLSALQEDLRKAEQYREFGRYGELIKSHLYELHKGQDTVTLIDYFDPELPTLTIPLNSAKDPVGNMNDFFRKYQKYLGAHQHLLPRIERQQNLIAELQKELTQMEEGQYQPHSSAQPTKMIQQPQMARRQKTHQTQGSGYRGFTSVDGLSIFVGKTAKDNDHLTFKIGKPDDLWLHARGTPGSHTIIQVEKAQVVPHETLKDAATLALWFSDLRKSGKGEVIYTQRKFVKKTRGQKLGSVHVTREKSLWVAIQKERLERLKGSASPAGKS